MSQEEKKYRQEFLFKSLWASDSDRVLKRFLTFQVFSFNYIKKYDNSFMVNLIVLNFSVIWMREPIKKGLKKETK